MSTLQLSTVPLLLGIFAFALCDWARCSDYSVGKLGHLLLLRLGLLGLLQQLLLAFTNLWASMWPIPWVVLIVRRSLPCMVKLLTTPPSMTPLLADRLTVLTRTASKLKTCRSSACETATLMTWNSPMALKSRRSRLSRAVSLLVARAHAANANGAWY